jgi:hypothetical protein
VTIAIIRGEPAGLMAAETAVEGGAQVELYDAMASVGRKFLLAGKRGLNLTHSEPPEAFLARYGPRQNKLAPIVQSFEPDAVREWAQSQNSKIGVGEQFRENSSPRLDAREHNYTLTPISCPSAITTVPASGRSWFEQRNQRRVALLASQVHRAFSG